MQTSQLNQLLKVIFIALLLAAVVMALVISVGMIQDNQSCTVGLAGTAASITFQGYRSDDVCQTFVGLNRPGNTYQIYAMTAPPQGTVLCEGEYKYDGISSVHYIIRDTGLFDLVGRQLCVNFAALSG
jgi:hypothetical protein